MELVLKLFSTHPLDDDAAHHALAFLLDYGGGVLRPQECGVYEPFEPFHASARERYVGWLTHPGGEFCFRRSGEPLHLKGCISNLLVSEIATVPQPSLRTRWSMRIGSDVMASDRPEFLEQLLCDACRTAQAEYGFVATDQDYRTKNFQSVKEGVSEIQQFVGDNPEHGVPGLYWMNFFGPMYVDHFGKQKLASLRDHADVVFLADGAVYLRFGRLPGDSHAPAALEDQRAVIRTLGEAAFFDLGNPNRQLDVPAALRSR